MLGDCTFDSDRPVDVADLDKLVITEVLAQPLLGPAVHQFLPCDLIQVLVWIVDNEGQLDVFSNIPSFLDLRVAVLHYPGLGVNPE